MRPLLDVIIRKSMSVLEVLAGQDVALLVRRNRFLILDLRLDVVDCVRVRGLDFECSCFTGKRLERNRR
jgi:hypothetical protein